MTFEERMDALTTRQESLTLTVEVMAGMLGDLLKLHAENETLHQALLKSLDGGK